MSCASDAFPTVERSLQDLFTNPQSSVLMSIRQFVSAALQLADRGGHARKTLTAISDGSLAP